MLWKGRPLIVLAVISLITVVASVSSIGMMPAHAQERLKKIRIAYGGPTLSGLVYLAARDLGFFSKNGLEVEMIVISTPVSIAALNSNEVDYLARLGPATVRSTLLGIPSRAIWFGSNRLLFTFMAQPQFKTLNDLKLRLIGVQGGLGATAHVALITAIEKVGANPKDFTFMSLPSVTDLIQALKSGAMAAALLSPPFDVYAESEGFSKILDVGSMVEMPQGGLTALMKTIQNRRDEGKSVIKSLQMAKDTMIKSKEKTIELMTRITKLDKESASKTFDPWKNAIAGNGIPTRSGMDSIIKMLKAQGAVTKADIRFEDVADATLATEVAKELGYEIH